jgi:hypothetical protein
MRLAEWTTGFPCDADNIVYCHRCKPRDLPLHVFRSAWSTAFHRVPGCKALVSAQGSVERRGGSPSEIVGVHVGVSHQQWTGTLPALLPGLQGANVAGRL